MIWILANVFANYYILVFVGIWLNLDKFLLVPYVRNEISALGMIFYISNLD